MLQNITGIYEVCIGTVDPIPMIEYWEQFGYERGEIGELSATAVKSLYGVNSNLQSIRLYHQKADHGLIRLMVWEKAVNDGLEMSSMRVKGNRWATSLTANVLNILNHAEEAAAAGLPVKYTNPIWSVIYQREKGRAFFDPPVGVREMMLLQPLTRQVLFQRFNYTIKTYGTINKESALKSSQITHMGMVIQDDSKESLRFYDEVLGLLRVMDDLENISENSPGGREIFQLQPQEKFWVTAFDDPRSSTDWKKARSGRLYIIRFPETIKLESAFNRSQPGSLGMSLYTYRVANLEEYFQRIKTNGVQKFTEIIPNEFGENSFSFVAPDGYFWTLLG